MYNNIKKLCNISAVSGEENYVQNEIISQISNYCEYSIDNLGNIIAFKKGKKSPKNKVMICAHMDEVGMIVTFITDDGKIYFDLVGGIDKRVVLGRSVSIGKNKVIGVIGTKAVHMQTQEERRKAVPISDLYIDIGANSKDEVYSFINIGDRICFNSDYIEYGENFIRAKSIDDRFGCALMIELIKIDLEYDCYFAFVVQEEVGLRGSKVAAYSIDPDIAIVFEATTACDLSGVSNNKRVCVLGDGPVVSYMDNATIYDKELYNLTFKLANENDIPCQTKTMIAGGNDSGAIHVSRSGVRTLAISIPCRYLHTSSCVANKNDLDNTFLLSKLVLNKLFDI